jgi:hypothetical protein
MASDFTIAWQLNSRFITSFSLSSADRRTSRKISLLYGDHHYGDDDEGPRLKVCEFLAG